MYGIEYVAQSGQIDTKRTEFLSTEAPITPMTDTEDNITVVNYLLYDQILAITG